MTTNNGASYDFITDRLAVGNVASRAVPGFVAVVTALAVRSEGRPWGPELTDKTPKVPKELTVKGSTAQQIRGFDDLSARIKIDHQVPVLIVDIADGEEVYRGSFTGNAHDRDLDTFLDDATTFITEHIRNGCVLVHCGAGVSRSAAIVTAYLCRYAGMSYCEALALVKSRRPCVAPCDAFERAVKRWMRLDDLATTGPRR